MQAPTKSTSQPTAHGGSGTGQLQPEDLQLLLKTGFVKSVHFEHLVQQRVDVLQGVSKEACAALNKVRVASYRMGQGIYSLL